MNPAAASQISFWSWLVPLLAAAAILALYFLKTRRHPVLVPSTLLWRRTIEDHRVNALWQKLRKSILLLLQLLAIAAAAIALLRPSWEGSQLRGGRYVFLLDNSASMAATDVSPTRLDEAKRRTVALIDKMRPGDSAMVVSFADTARIEQSFTDNREQLRRAVAAVRQTERTTSLDEALRLCAGRAVAGRTTEEETEKPAEDDKPAQVFLFSDGNFAQVNDDALGRLDLAFVPIGTTTTKNLAVVRLAVRRNLDSPRKAQALARIRNFGDAPRTVTAELRIVGDDKKERLIDARQLSMGAATQQDVVFTSADAPDGVWELRIAGNDDELPIDDKAWAVLAPPIKTRLLVVTPGNRFLAAALATDEARLWCDARFQTPDYLATSDYRDSAERGAYDLILFDRCRPSAMPACHTMFFGTVPPGDGWKSDAKLTVPQAFDTAQAHPLMQNVSLAEVLIAEATPPIGPSGRQTLVDSPQGPLATSAPRDGFEDVVFGFSLLDAAGSPQTNWPVVDGAGFEQFVLNAVQYFGRGRGGEDGALLRPGAPVRLALEAGTKPATVVGPDGARIAVNVGRTASPLFYETERIGPYEVRVGDSSGADSVRQRFAVNLCEARESAVAAAEKPKLRVGQEEIVGQTTWEAARLEGWKPFLLLVLVLLAGEWYTYGRRAGW
jgi:hypothetical protein